MEASGFISNGFLLILVRIPDNNGSSALFSGDFFKKITGNTMFSIVDVTESVWVKMCVLFLSLEAYAYCGILVLRASALQYCYGKTYKHMCVFLWNSRLVVKNIRKPMENAYFHMCS